MTAQTPSTLFGKDFQRSWNYSNTAGACRGTHLPQTRYSKPHHWMVADPGAHNAFTCSSSSHIVFSSSSHISPCTLCLLSFLTLKFNQLLYILWLPVITNKQNFLHDWFYDGLGLSRLWIWFCIIKGQKKTAMDVLELICLRDGLECEVRRSVCLNTGILLDCLHFLLLFLHIISLTTLIGGYFRLFIQHLCQTWFQIIRKSMRILSFQIFFFPPNFVKHTRNLSFRTV